MSLLLLLLIWTEAVLWWIRYYNIFRWRVSRPLSIGESTTHNHANNKTRKETCIHSLRLLAEDCSGSESSRHGSKNHTRLHNFNAVDRRYSHLMLYHATMIILALNVVGEGCFGSPKCAEFWINMSDSNRAPRSQVLLLLWVLIHWHQMLSWETALGAFSAFPLTPSAYPQYQQQVIFKNKASVSPILLSLQNILHLISVC